MIYVCMRFFKSCFLILTNGKITKSYITVNQYFVILSLAVEINRLCRN